MNRHDSERQRLAELIAASRRMAVLTGAGISTESGIPDFRSPGGIWSRFRLIEHGEFMASREARLEDWRRRFYMEDQLGRVESNAGHHAVAAWVLSGKCPVLITQNIDGLHQQAGTPADAVIEIHGNARRAHCTDCGLRHEVAECREQLDASGEAPSCRQCGGIVKSDVVMFGEAMPARATEAAFDAAGDCDLFLAIGTSLQVHPAAGLPVAAKQNGARLVILNRDPTELDPCADLVIHAGIGEILSRL
ncbi:MAG: NAD-dependent deacylase [Nitratireductor sp.]|nr:NAD-dependent deacylase [Nitratireductor sp.]